MNGKPHQIERRWRSRLVGAATAALCVVVAAGAWAQTPVDSAEELAQICRLSTPDIDGVSAEMRDRYHRQRREVTHRVYETSLGRIDSELLGYDRVSGLLTLSGFRTHRPHDDGPAIRFRNECIPSFEVQDEQAHDLKARLQMGTVEVRIGFSVAAHTDWNIEFCSSGNDGKTPELHVDLLYARLVDTERSEADGGEVIDIYRTRKGFRRALRSENLLHAGGRFARPDVEISDVQWRAADQKWEEAGESSAQLTEDVHSALERAVYPCYVDALQRNATLQGAMVVEIAVDDGGDGPTAEVLVDTIQSGGLTGCTVDRIARLELFEEAGEREAAAVMKATILLRRQ